MSKVIAGIGSRQCPENILDAIYMVGEWCARLNIYVRSGRAQGADQAWSSGAADHCIEYLPWSGFEKDFPSQAHSYILEDPIPRPVLDLVRKYHPAADRLSRGALRLMSRNCYQVLGASLKDPVSAIVCWTEEISTRNKINWKGGTGFACRMATDLNIPILNMWHEKYNTAEKVIVKLKELLEI